TDRPSTIQATRLRAAIVLSVSRSGSVATKEATTSSMDTTAARRYQRHRQNLALRATARLSAEQQGHPPRQRGDENSASTSRRPGPVHREVRRTSHLSTRRGQDRPTASRVATTTNGRVAAATRHTSPGLTSSRPTGSQSPSKRTRVWASIGLY